MLHVFFFFFFSVQPGRYLILLVSDERVCVFGPILCMVLIHAPPLACLLYFLLSITDTGNSCQHTGYSEFNPSSWPGKCAPSKGDWINTVVGMCGEGDAYPEEFWNCADIEIAGGPFHDVQYVRCLRVCTFYIGNTERGTSYNVPGIIVPYDAYPRYKNGASKEFYGGSYS